MKLSNNLKQLIRSTFKKLGLEVSRYNPDILSQPNQKKRYEKNLLYEADSTFQKLYSQGSRISGTPDTRLIAYISKREERFYNLMQLLMQTISYDGKLVECGCWKGLSSYMLCNYMREYNSSFNGQDFFIVDSFKGLSEPSAFDKIIDLGVTGKEEISGQPSGAFSASIQEVKNTLSDFPEITYFQGWIPSAFKDIPDAEYKFVHIDVDLYEPVHHSVSYFYPRLVNGGMIVIDDYGSLYWPGAKKAVDEYCTKNNIDLLRLSTGQAVIWKK